MNYTTEKLIERVISAAIAVCTLGLVNYVHRGTHVSQVKSFCIKYIRCTYSHFEQEFNNTEWWFNPSWPDSLFREGSVSDQCHANIFCINGTGMIFTTWGYLKACSLVKRKIKELKSAAIENRRKQAYEY